SLDLVTVGLGRRRGQIGGERIDAVVEAAGLLHRGAAAEIEHPRRGHGRAGAAAAALQHQNFAARFARLDRGADPGDAIAADDDVGLAGPFRYLGFGDDHRAGARTATVTAWRPAARPKNEPAASEIPER